ncbi:hypothetical protein [Metabacillus dongyingensis]|uniref:hypothetical protein n=1 Tax=Metabacillus dongyingensis TaxID=2874282 RepID=UPI001F0B4F4D|nr:hypothetical protein [Metabacillus dongyingensis]UAL50756.1 hypothetical protein K8L98_16140 [Metabacillus dongyingensis]
MNDYVSIFEGKINSIHHHENGSVLQALYTLKGQEIMCIDSIVQHVFFYTGNFLFVACYAFEKLLKGCSVLMPLAASSVSEK